MRKEAAVIIAILLLLLFGCSPDSGSSSSTVPNFRTGNGGLTVGFMPNAPPSRVFLKTDERNVITLGLEAKNKGAEEAANGIVIIGGFDPTIISWPTSQTFPTVGARDVFNPDGGLESVELTGAVNLDAMGDSYKPTILATTCYSYKTQADIGICVDPDPFNSKPKACSVSSTSVSGGQGGPIGVSRVNIDAAKGSQLIQIVIKNMGDGEPFWTSQGTSKCLPSNGGVDERKELGIVILGKVMVGTKDITSSCKGVGFSAVRLTKGEATIFCTLTTDTSLDAYKTILSVDTGYLYRTTTSRSIDISKLP